MQNTWDKSTLQPTATGHLGYAQIPGDFLLISRDAVSGTNLIQVWGIFLYIKLSHSCNEFCDGISDTVLVVILFLFLNFTVPS